MEMEKLCRFNHHPNPAIDFCIEVEELTSLFYDAMYIDASLFTEYNKRLPKALDFIARVDTNAINASKFINKLSKIKTRDELNILMNNN